MSKVLQRQHWSNWRARLYQLGQRARRSLSAPWTGNGSPAGRDPLLDPPIESEYVDLLFDPAFRRSLAEVKQHSCQDVVRLANLWNLVRMADAGIYMEVGSFQGGTALHICNAMRDANWPFYCFDPFENAGFELLHDCDQVFADYDFTQTSFAQVKQLLSGKSNAQVIQGFFPTAAQNLALNNVAFCHLDVDVYEATRQSLQYLAPRMSPRGLILVDDVDHRETPGVKRALANFLAERPDFSFIPMFPCQGLLLHLSAERSNLDQ